MNCSVILCSLMNGISPCFAHATQANFQLQIPILVCSQDSWCVGTVAQNPAASKNLFTAEGHTFV